MAAQGQHGPSALTQSKEILLKTYGKQMKGDVKSMIDNFTEIIRKSKVIVK